MCIVGPAIFLFPIIWPRQPKPLDEHNVFMSSAIESSVTVAAGGPRRGRPRRQYKCAFCAKAFKRSEHCIRHERTHTQEKPFVCRYCSKSYSRK